MYLACRDEKAAEEVVTELKTKTKSEKIFFMKCDLASLKSVQSFADAFKKSKLFAVMFNTFTLFFF